MVVKTDNLILDINIEEAEIKEKKHRKKQDLQMMLQSEEANMMCTIDGEIFFLFTREHKLHEQCKV